MINVVDEGLASPRTHELIVGATQQLGKDSSVGLNLIARRRQNELWQVPFVYDEAGARVLAADMGYDSLVSIDLATGNRTFLPGAPAVMTDIWGMALDKARSRLLLTRK